MCLCKRMTAGAAMESLNISTTSTFALLCRIAVRIWTAGSSQEEEVSFPEVDSSQEADSFRAAGSFGKCFRLVHCLAYRCFRIIGKRDNCSVSVTAGVPWGAGFFACSNRYSELDLPFIIRYDGRRIVNWRKGAESWTVYFAKL